MTLLECLNNTRTKDFHSIFYIQGDFEVVLPFIFNVSLEDVALIEDNGECFLISRDKCYFISDQIKYSNDFYLEPLLETGIDEFKRNRPKSI